MKKLVLKLDLHDDKDKSKALRIVSGLAGVDAVVPDMNVKKLTVIGTVDPVRVVSKLRKFWHTEIVSAGPAREPTKKEEKKEEGKKDEPKKEEAKEEEKKEEPKKEEANRKKRRRRNWDQRREARLTDPTILPYHTGHTSILSHAHTLSKRIEMRALSSNLVRYRILDSQLVVAVDANPTTYARTEKML